VGLNVGCGEGNDAWFDPSLVENIGYDPEGTMTVGDQRFVRDADGNWMPESSN
jgi:hypothetical protein